jgi:hypothetical protein
VVIGVVIVIIISEAIGDSTRLFYPRLYAAEHCLLQLSVHSIFLSYAYHTSTMSNTISLLSSQGLAVK